MEHATSCIRSWIAKHFLCLNNEKTEAVVIGSRSSLSKLSIPSVSIGYTSLLDMQVARVI